MIWRSRVIGCNDDEPCFQNPEGDGGEPYYHCFSKPLLLLPVVETPLHFKRTIQSVKASYRLSLLSY